MRHRLSGLSIYGLNGLDREMSTPPTLRRGTAHFTFFIIGLGPEWCCYLGLGFEQSALDLSLEISFLVTSLTDKMTKCSWTSAII